MVTYSLIHVAMRYSIRHLLITIAYNKVFRTAYVDHEDSHIFQLSSNLRPTVLCR